MSIRIGSEDSLKRVADYCHDAVFETDKITYNREMMIFSLVLTREMWEKAERTRSVLFFHRFRVPKTESVLTLYDVVGIDIHKSDVQDILVDIQYDANENSVSFKCMKGTKICLKVRDLTGILEDTGKEYFDGTRFTSFSVKS